MYPLKKFGKWWKAAISIIIVLAIAIVSEMFNTLIGRYISVLIFGYVCLNVWKDGRP
jgi:hypothetical protein